MSLRRAVRLTVVTTTAVAVATAPAAQGEGRAYGLYQARVSGATRGKHALYINPAATICDLSPDRTRMFIFDPRGVGTTDLHGHDWQKLASAYRWDTYGQCAHWSPDGRWIASRTDASSGSPQRMVTSSAVSR